MLNAFGCLVCGPGPRPGGPPPPSYIFAANSGCLPFCFDATSARRAQDLVVVGCICPRISNVFGRLLLPRRPGPPPPPPPPPAAALPLTPGSSPRFAPILRYYLPSSFFYFFFDTASAQAHQDLVVAAFSHALRTFLDASFSSVRAPPPLLLLLYSCLPCMLYVVVVCVWL